MVIRLTFILPLFILSGTVVLGQSAVSQSQNSSFNEASENHIQRISPPSEKMIHVVDTDDSFHLSGIAAEARLKDPAIKKDDQLTERDFIIERSPDIRIEYVPEKKKINPSKEKPL